jgi:leader peptidase (prepilin peptidase)/N-methyltransferase
MTVSVVLICAAFGLIIGSFLNVCIARLPAGESVMFPGSRCPSCRMAIHWYDNIPVLSFLLLGGKCRACRAPISARYPAIEAATGLAFAVQAYVNADDFAMLASRLVFTALLVVLFGTDLETQRLPNVLTIPGAIVGLIFSVWLPPGLRDSLIGLALGGGILLAVRWVWERVKHVEAMGLGDVKMLAMIGAFLGWRQVWVVLFFGSVAGALIGIGMAAARRGSMQTRLPFGTFLALAAFAASLVGDRLVNWYLAFYQ